MQNERLTFVHRVEMVAVDNLRLKSRIWDQVLNILKLSELEKFATFCCLKYFQPLVILAIDHCKVSSWSSL